MNFSSIIVFYNNQNFVELPQIWRDFNLAESGVNSFISTRILIFLFDTISICNVTLSVGMYVHPWCWLHPQPPKPHLKSLLKWAFKY